MRYHNYSIILFCFLFITSCASNKQIEIVKNPYKDYEYGFISGEKPIEWNSNEGRKRLIRTKYNKPFFLLAHHFSGQDYPTTCGVASMRIILSSIYEKSNEMFLKDEEHTLTEDKNGKDYAKYILTERNIFDYYKKSGGKAEYDVIARQKKNKNKHFAGGISKTDLVDILNSHPNVFAEYKELSNADFSIQGVNNFRELVKNITISNNKYLILNYHLAAMFNNKDTGHYSPIVAYDEKTDSVLIMDVASHLGTWVWVKLEEIYRMMNSIGGVKRGYIVVVNKSITDKKEIKQGVKQDDIKNEKDDVKDNDDEIEEIEEKKTIITKKNVKSKQNQEILTENEEETNEKDNTIDEDEEQEQLKIVKKSKEENVRKNDKQNSNSKNITTPIQNRKKIRRKIIKRTKTYKINNASTNVY